MNEINPRASGLPDCSAYEGPDFPAKKKVLLLNDDFTTQDFVVAVLMLIFHKSGEEAVALMETVHRTGKGYVGEYPYDIAATKCAQVRKAAKERGFPLRCILE